MKLDDFKQRLQENALPVVVDFWAPWCGPCRAISPALEGLGKEYSGRVDLWKVNADEEPEILRALKIYGIPTMLVFQRDREVMRRTGAQPQKQLAELFEAALNGQAPAHLGLAPFDRILRLAVAAGLFVLSWNTSNSPWLYTASAVVFFSAVYDRCPIWQAIAPRLRSLFRQAK